MLKRCVCALGLLFLLVQTVYAQEPTGLPPMNRASQPHASFAHQSSRQIASPFEDRFELIDIDTLFYIENKGLTRIMVNLNGYSFKLVVDSLEVRQSDNAFLIPHYDEITLNIAAYIRRGDDNFMEIASQGPEGSSAEVIIGDLLLPGRQVAYPIENLNDLPEAIDLLQNYPNPFSDRTTVVYEIAEIQTNGVQVTLSLYDVLGRRVRVLVDERRYPGTFTVDWDGTGDHGRDLASAVYFCRLVAGEVHATRRLVRSR